MNYEGKKRRKKKHQQPMEKSSATSEISITGYISLTVFSTAYTNLLIRGVNLNTHIKKMCLFIMYTFLCGSVIHIRKIMINEKKNI